MSNVLLVLLMLFLFACDGGKSEEEDLDDNGDVVSLDNGNSGEPDSKNMGEEGSSGDDNGGGNSNQNDNDSVDVTGSGEAYNAISIASSANLPDCDVDTQGSIYFIDDLALFKKCDADVWTHIELDVGDGTVVSVPDSGQIDDEGGGETETEYYNPDDNTFQVTKSELVDGETVSTTIVYQGDSSAGSVLRTCYYKYSLEFLKSGVATTGTIQTFKYWGDDKCPVKNQVFFSCQAGYKAKSMRCVVDTGNSVDSSDEVTCGADEVKADDGTCGAVTYVNISGNLCGTYKEPVRVLSGDHLVTCNVDFKDRLVVDAGAVIKFDDDWDLNAASYVRVDGTVGSNVVFTTSGGNPGGAWGKLVLAGKESLSVDAEFTFQKGSKVDYARFEPATAVAGKNILTLTNIFGSNVTMNANLGSTSTVANGVLKSSSVGSAMTVTKVKFLSSAATGAVTLKDGSIGLWSTFGTLTLYSSIKNHPSMVAYSTVASCANIGTQTYFYGNNTNATTCAAFNDGNVDGAISSKNLVFSHGINDGTAVVDEPVNVKILGVNKDGFIDSPTLSYQATYVVDGVSNTYGNWDLGVLAEFTFDAAEVYKISVLKLNNSVDFLGDVDVTVSVDNL